MSPPSSPDIGPTLWAWSDLHVGFPEARAVVERTWPSSPDDWLIVAGDLAERAADVQAALALFASRYAKVIWTPGNHELWTHPSDPVPLRGVQRYEMLVGLARDLGVVTPEDTFPVWHGRDGDLVICPLFVLYDYSFTVPGCSTIEEGLQRARTAGVVCADEHFLHPDPFPSRRDWCSARLEHTRQRLDQVDRRMRTLLVNHYPLVRQPTEVMRYADVFSQWCGTVETADWHRRYNADAVVYGHLHIPRTIRCDGVPFIEVSLGYPREWPLVGGPRGPRDVLAEMALE